jgi:hypothetical protein
LSWHEERERLLTSRISELNLRLEGSEIEPLAKELYRELGERQLAFKPPIYLTDEWGCPEGVPVIGVPFYLAHPQLARIEEEMVESVETKYESMMYLRHEAGHAFNYAYCLYERDDWHRVFGPYSRPYIETYKPNPFSRDFVRHIAGWYAQKHPDEDFAETFAVWLTPGQNWREEYAGTGALAKLEYVDRVMHEIESTTPRIESSKRETPVEEMTVTVRDYYERRPDRRGIEVPRWFDGDLRNLFDRDGDPAAPLLRDHRLDVIHAVTYWTGAQPAIVRSLIDHLIGRVEALDLRAGDDEVQASITSFTAMATTLALNYLHRGTFAP